MPTNSKPVITEMRGDHIFIAKINRPQAHNAISFEVMDGLESVCDEIEQNEDIRVLILTGEGHKFFASGGDLKQFADLKSEQEARKMSMRMGEVLRRIESADCWTIALINGDAYGGGCEVMLAFDFRIAAKHARFGFTQGRFYLTPGWGGLTRLIERVNRSTALLWLGTQALVDTESALIAGLIDMADSSSQLENHIMEMAERLSENDRRIIKVMKEGATYAQKYPHRESINNERTEFSKLWATDEHHRRVEAFLKRKKTDGL
ncbi:enoyl-CoA hydratase [Cyclonatronum proteinivorum]|uniref:Enoyl-CoA hydratase n=1 Tax=Cyclonatronum proteinivorum TaxID=1457365 RepID=A0A345UHN8_9BACT|nr:enoyl-CoA hydratase/isomerase family protein [Cyclonatronum proteinivorum]AXI99989.1 enoyl-CoA hydratase [Cyclonatronum proteinivorum]